MFPFFFFAPIVVRFPWSGDVFQNDWRLPGVSVLERKRTYLAGLNVLVGESRGQDMRKEKALFMAEPRRAIVAEMLQSELKQELGED